LLYHGCYLLTHLHICSVNLKNYVCCRIVSRYVLVALLLVIGVVWYHQNVMSGLFVVVGGVSSVAV